MVDGWSGPAGEILRLTPLVKYHVKNTLFCKTDSDRLEAASPGTLTLDETLPQLQLYFLMGLVYSVITPVIIPFIVVFMGFGFVVYRHQVQSLLPSIWVLYSRMLYVVTLSRLFFNKYSLNRSSKSSLTSVE